MAIVTDIISVLTLITNNYDNYSTNNNNINTLLKKIITLTSTIDELKTHTSTGINTHLQELLCLITSIKSYSEKYKRKNKVISYLTNIKIKKQIIFYDHKIDSLLQAIKFELDIHNNTTLQCINDATLSNLQLLSTSSTIDITQIINIVNNNNLLMQNVFKKEMYHHCTLLLNENNQKLSSIMNNYYDDVVDLIESHNNKFTSEIDMLNNKINDLTTELNNIKNDISNDNNITNNCVVTNNKNSNNTIVINDNSININAIGIINNKECNITIIEIDKKTNNHVCMNGNNKITINSSNIILHNPFNSFISNEFIHINDYISYILLNINSIIYIKSLFSKIQVLWTVTMDLIVDITTLKIGCKQLYSNNSLDYINFLNNVLNKSLYLTQSDFYSLIKLCYETMYNENISNFMPNVSLFKTIPIINIDINIINWIKIHNNDKY